MNIIICDDIKPESSNLERVLNESGYDIKTRTFSSGYDVLDYVRSGAIVDACFLDIIMPEMNGVELAKELRASGYMSEIVFLTRSREYGPESYAVNAFSYLLKPLGPEAIRDVLNKLENIKKNGDTKGILIKVSKVARNVLFRDISHIEVIKHCVYFRLISGEEIEIYATFKEISQQLLSDRRFAQCHRSYVVNLSDVAAIDEREIIMRSGKKIPYSESYPEIKKKFTKWIIGGTNNES